MSHSVVVEIAAGRETPPADLALMRLFTGVYPTVSVEGAGGTERFIAQITRVWFFT